LQQVKKLPAFQGTRRFITALTNFRQLSLSWASPIQSIYPHLTPCRSILILSTHLHLGLPSGLLHYGFPTKTLYTPYPHPYAPHAQPISFFSILSPAQYWLRSTSHLSPRYAISTIPPLPRAPKSKYFPQHPVLKHPHPPFLPRTADNATVTIVPNVKVKVTARHSIYYLNLHELLAKHLPLSRPSRDTEVANRKEVRCTFIRIIRQRENT